MKQKRRKRFDQCNICGKFEKLSDDHVPPKSCFNKEKVVYNNYYEDVANAKARITGDELYAYKISQNGIKFPSLCAKCNNTLLGANYDHELERLAKCVHNLVSSQVTLPSNVTLSLNVNKLSRSVIGHLLAAKNKYDGQVLTDRKMREYFLDETLLPPKDMKLLFRLYPYESIIIHRDFVVGSLIKTAQLPSGTVDCLSFYPIAFVLCSGASSCGLVDIFKYGTSTIDDMIDFPIDLSSHKHPNSNVVRHFLWPTNVSDDEYGTMFLLTSGASGDSVIAKKK